MDAVEKRIVSLDPQSLSSDEKLMFIRFLNVLKGSIEIALAKTRGPAVIAAAQLKKVKEAAPLSRNHRVIN